MRSLRRLLAAALLLCCVAGCGGADDGGADRSAAPVTSDGECSDDLVQGLAAWGAVGFSGVVVAEGDGTSCSVAVGTADRERDRPMSTASVFSIGSVSKTVVAAAVLQLVADDIVSLGDPAGTFLPTLRGPVAEAPIESLLQHTSGLVGSHGEDHVALSREEAIDAIGALEVDASAVGQFLYSNAGYTLLALVVEEVTDGGYRQYLADRILPEGAGFWDGAPAAVGDRAVGYADGRPTDQRGDLPGPHWALEGNGDMAMTAGQLARWTRDLFGGRSLDPAVGASMARQASEQDGQAMTIGWSRLGGEVLGEPALASAGGGGAIGHDVVVAWLPDPGRALVFASNGDRVTAEALAQAIGSAIAAGDPVPHPDAPVDVEAGTLATAAGTYETDGGGRFEVTVDGDELVVVLTGGDALGALLPTDGHPEEEVVAHEAAVGELLAEATKAGAEEDEEGGEDAAVLVTNADVALADAHPTLDGLRRPPRHHEQPGCSAFLDVERPARSLPDPHEPGSWTPSHAAPVRISGDDRLTSGRSVLRRHGASARRRSSRLDIGFRTRREQLRRLASGVTGVPPCLRGRARDELSTVPGVDRSERAMGPTPGEDVSAEGPRST